MLVLLATSSFQFGNKDDMTQWVVLCVGVMATAYLVMRGRLRKRQDPMARAATTGMGLSQQRQVERDISNLMVEMLETARHMTAQLDTRAARLEAIIVEADAKLAALKGALANESASAPIPLPPDQPDAVPVGAPSSQESPAAEAPAPEMKPEAPPDPRHADVYALADQGRSTGEIARSLNRPNGEVELILALRRN
jgi:hypothetical protein